MSNPECPFNSITIYSRIILILLHRVEMIKDPKLLIKKLKNEKEQINELVSQGEADKAEEMKKNIAWQKALDKTAGKKVCSQIWNGFVVTQNRT